MSLQLKHFVEGFTKRCSQYGFTSKAAVEMLLKRAADDALSAAQETYKTQGKAGANDVERDPLLQNGVSSYDENRSEKYPIRS